MNHIIGALAPTPTPSVKTLTVDEDSAGQRLDNFLMRHLKGVPKTHVYRIIRSGEVRVNKGRASADQRVEAGDLVRLPPVRISAQVQAKADAPAPAREFPVLMEDEAMMAINKPAGVAGHGGSGVSFGGIGQLRRAQFPAGRLDRKLELVAVHVVAVGDPVAHLERARVQRLRRKLESQRRVEQFLRAGKPVQEQRQQQGEDSVQA